jgi:glyoxylase-like metal-dependent hydrolase (beta-lactamase superfamily II)
MTNLDDGLVLVDVGSQSMSGAVHRMLRTWTDLDVHTAVYSHGRIDHVFGLHRWEAEARDRPRPRVVAHEAVAARFDRYIRTADYNTVINRRQFGIDDLEWPSVYRYPDRTFRDRPDLEVGGVRAQLHHDRGETDDHAWV